MYSLPNYLVKIIGLFGKCYEVKKMDKGMSIRIPIGVYEMLKRKKDRDGFPSVTSFISFILGKYLNEENNDSFEKS